MARTLAHPRIILIITITITTKTNRTRGSYEFISNECCHRLVLDDRRSDLRTTAGRVPVLSVGLLPWCAEATDVRTADKALSRGLLPWDRSGKRVAFPGPDNMVLLPRDAAESRGVLNCDGLSRDRLVT